VIENQPNGCHIFDPCDHVHVSVLYIHCHCLLSHSVQHGSTMLLSNIIKCNYVKFFPIATRPGRLVLTSDPNCNKDKGPGKSLKMHMKSPGKSSKTTFSVQYQHAANRTWHCQWIHAKS